MRLYIFSALFAVVSTAFSPVPALGATGPSVREVVEFTKIFQPLAGDTEGMRQQISPDGTQAFIVTRKADVESDTNRYEIQMLSLDPARLAASRPARPEVVFALDAKFDNFGGLPALDNVRWTDDRTMVFRAKMHDEIFQVYRLNVVTREVMQLTQSSTPITSFDVSTDLKRLVYAARFPNPPLKEGQKSIVVGNQWGRGLAFGNHSLLDQIQKYRFYVQDVGSGRAPRPLGEPFLQANAGMPVVNISPDGRWAILPRYERERARAWFAQYPLLAEQASLDAPAMKRDPLGYFSGSTASTARRMVAWRLDDAREQVILDAPDDAFGGGGQARRDKVWQFSGTSLVLAGTHLPLVDGQTSTASHVIEYWPDTGRWIIVAKLQGRLRSAAGAGDRVEVDDDGRQRQFQRVASGAWQEVPPVALSTPSSWLLDIQQSLNEPPEAVARGPAGQTVRLTALNPQFNVGNWGEMSSFRWRDDKGRAWEGGLLLPAGKTPGRRWPLLIQAYVYNPKSFYLDGPNSAKQGFTSAYPGRAIVREGVAVLAMRYRPQDDTGDITDHENSVFIDGVKGAVRALDEGGRVDPGRIGAIGFSAMGAKVMNLITFSDLLIRAATLSDGDEDTLYSYAVSYGYSDYTWGYKEMVNRGLPVRPTLAEWVARDPSLNTDCVKTALRIESYGVAQKNYWDIYALMRRQYKPAEMILIPGGTHGLSTPSERMISLQGNVDWFNYWLQGKKREGVVLTTETPASLRAQNEAWDQMRTMKEADDLRPRCPLKSAR